MKGKAKLIRESDDRYHVYTRNYFWQRWKPLRQDDSSEPLTFKNFKEFGEVTQIEGFDEITIQYNKFRGFVEYEQI